MRIDELPEEYRPLSMWQYFLYQILFGIPIIVLVGLAPKSTAMTFIVLGICLVYYACLMAIIFSKTNRKSLDSSKA